jgi:RimJ/RimL family protein N-acetyltransferase
MTTGADDLGPPIGPRVEGWTPRPVPPRTPIEGRTCRIEPVGVERHAGELDAAFRADTTGRGWRYLPYGPFADADAFADWLQSACLGHDPLFFAITPNATARTAGLASYLRIDPPNGVIEIGHIHFAPELARTPAATEALYLMLRRVFDELGYRRCEWKCDALNDASRRAAERLGFSYEGSFRQAAVVKGRNRDTAWYALLDHEWPAAKRAFEAWLDPASFDAEGRQRRRLADFR